jgi:hypothetical protein
MSIRQALNLAPRAVLCGLHAADHHWIERFGHVPAHEAVGRLNVRSFQNPDGLFRSEAGHPQNVIL